MAHKRANFLELIVCELHERHGALTAGEAASLVKRSKSHMRHEFRAASGISFRMACFHARLEHGRNLLLSTRKSVPEISAILLYSEPSKFQKAFKRKYGVTPAAYRKLQG